MNVPEIRCKECDRFLGIKGVKTLIAQIRCPNSKCKLINDIYVVTTSSSETDIRFKFPVVDDNKSYPVE